MNGAGLVLEGGRCCGEDEQGMRRARRCRAVRLCVGTESGTVREGVRSRRTRPGGPACVRFKGRGSNSTVIRQWEQLAAEEGACGEREGGGKGVGSLLGPPTSHPRKQEKVELMGARAGGRTDGALSPDCSCCLEWEAR